MLEGLDSDELGDLWSLGVDLRNYGPNEPSVSQPTHGLMTVGNPQRLETLGLVHKVQAPWLDSHDDAYALTERGEKAAALVIERNTYPDPTVTRKLLQVRGKAFVARMVAVDNS